MFLCVYHLKKHQVDVFFVLFDYFDVIVLENKKNKENYFDIFLSKKYIWKASYTTISNTQIK